MKQKVLPWSNRLEQRTRSLQLFSAHDMYDLLVVVPDTQALLLDTHTWTPYATVQLIF